MPQNAPASLHRLAALIDDIWHAAGELPLPHSAAVRNYRMAMLCVLSPLSVDFKTGTIHLTPTTQAVVVTL
jgi:hypothetical protein